VSHPSPVEGSIARRADAVPAPAFFLAGALSQYLGAAVAVTLFERLGAPAVGWLRVAFSAVLLLGLLVGLRRPPRPRGFDRTQWRAIAAFGAVLGLMNVLYYLAIARLPLGTATAIEFSGPIAVAAAGARTRRAWLALALATAGVALLADVQWQASPLGVGLALGAAAMWAGYIVAGKRMTGHGAGLDGLAWSLAVGAVVTAPIGVTGLARHDAAVTALAVAGCALVGLLSNVIPYGLDVVVLSRLATSQFALLLSLLPVTAAVVGVVVLGQVPARAEVLGIALVVAAVGLRPSER
jgi:inner membrane transporter RhtA